MHLILGLSLSNLSELPMCLKSLQGRKACLVFVKPDLSQAECVQHSTIMLERWCLIQFGDSWKIKENALYVDNKLHGHVSNSKCTCVSAGSDSHPVNLTVLAGDASPIVQNDQ